MRKCLISFLAGCLIGATLVFAFLLSHQKSSEDSHALETLDYAITEWTNAKDNDFEVARIGLPGAKVGFIPDTVRSLAQHVQDIYGVPKGVTISQWILESRFGTRDLGAENYFGHSFAAVKQFMPSPQFVWRRDKIMSQGVITTGPPVRFAQYKGIAESFDTHGKYLSQSKRYQNAFATKSAEVFAKRLSSAGYAADPDYGTKLIIIMRRYRL